MNAPPILSNPPDRLADGDLERLAGFNFIYAAMGLACLLASIFIRYVAPGFVKLMSPEAAAMLESTRPVPADLQFHATIIVQMLFIFLNLLSGFCLWRRRDRRASLIVAGLNCLQIPFGTVLGVFTFIVLRRPAVKDLYRNNFEAPPMKAAYRQFKDTGAHLGIW
jgi:hypothetical protein